MGGGQGGGGRGNLRSGIDFLRSAWCGLGRDDLRCHGLLGEAGAEAKARPQLGLGALESEGTLERQRGKAKMRALPQAKGDVAQPPLEQPEVLVWPSEAGASPSPAPLSTCFPWNWLLSAKGDTSGGRSRRGVRASVQEGQLRLNPQGPSPLTTWRPGRLPCPWKPQGCYSVQEE